MFGEIFLPPMMFDTREKWEFLNTIAATALKS